MASVQGNQQEDDRELFGEESTIYSTQEKLLELLRREGSTMRKSSTSFNKKDLITCLPFYQNLQFSQEEMKNIANMVRTKT